MSGEGPVLGQAPERPAAAEVSALRALGRPAALLTLTIAAGQVFGVIRELFVAAEVGTSPTLDAYLIAVVLPTMIVSLVVGGTAIAMVPAYVGTLERQGDAEARRLIGAILTWATLLSGGAAIFLVWAAPVAVALAGPGLDANGQAEAIGFIPILAPMVAFGSLAGLLVAVYQIRERFVPIAASWLLGPLVSLVVTVIGWERFEMQALAMGTTLGALAMLLVLLADGLLTRALPRPSLRAKGLEVARFGRHAAPLWASSAILNLTIVGDRAVASVISPGSVSALRFGDAILRVPVNTLGPAWTTVIYPSLVRAARPGTARSLGDETGANLRYLATAFVPLAVATAAMAPLIIDVVYRRGAFGLEAAAMTSAVLAAFAPLLVLTMANSILVSAHNARQAGTLLLAVGVLNVILNLGLDIVFGLAIGVAGVALSSSVTMAIVTSLLAWRLRRPAGLRLSPVLEVGGKALVAALVPGIPIALFIWTRPWSGPVLSELGVLVLLTLLGGIAYVVVARVIRLREPWVILQAMVPTIRRRA